MALGQAKAKTKAVPGSRSKSKTKSNAPWAPATPSLKRARGAELARAVTVTVKAVRGMGARLEPIDYKGDWVSMTERDTAKHIIGDEAYLPQSTISRNKTDCPAWPPIPAGSIHPVQYVAVGVYARVLLDG